MSIYQCRTDGQRIKGSPSTIYGNLFGGGYQTRKRLHFCATHAPAAQVAATKGLHLVYIGDVAQVDVDDLPVDCRSCSSYGTYTLTVYSYVKGEEERVHTARFCDQHVDEPASGVDLAL